MRKWVYLLNRFKNCRGLNSRRSVLEKSPMPNVDTALHHFSDRSHPIQASFIVIFILRRCWDSNPCIVPTNLLKKLTHYQRQHLSRGGKKNVFVILKNTFFVFEDGKKWSKCKFFFRKIFFDSFVVGKNRNVLTASSSACARLTFWSVCLLIAYVCCSLCIPI